MMPNETNNISTPMLQKKKKKTYQPLQRFIMRITTNQYHEECHED